jgi:hypothetical protein
VHEDLLEQVAKELRSAAGLLPTGMLQRSLTLRADALLSNEYWDSNVAWVDTDANPFEVTLGPYEVYSDTRFGLKAAFEAFIGLPDNEMSGNLKELSSQVPAFDRALADRLRYPLKGESISLQVVHDVYRGGEAMIGRQFVAFNLPNERRFQETKGSKNILSRTMMEAKFFRIGLPIAQRILTHDDLERYVFKNHMLFVLAHELAHGLGPGIIRQGDQNVSINVLLRDLYSPIEEVKANVLGAVFLQHLVTERRLKLDDLHGCMITEAVGYLQDLRIGYGEAHSAGSIVQYNWLKEHGAISYDRSKKVLRIAPEIAIVAMAKLSEECIRIQLEGSYGYAESFLERWAVVAPEIVEIAELLADLPFEVSPTYRLH